MFAIFESSAKMCEADQRVQRPAIRTSINHGSVLAGFWQAVKQLYRLVPALIILR
jgi:hypothetical protein